MGQKLSKVKDKGRRLRRRFYRKNRIPGNPDQESENQSREPLFEHREPPDADQEPDRENLESHNEPHRENQEPDNENQEPDIQNREPKNKNPEPRNEDPEPDIQKREPKQKDPEPRNENPEPEDEYSEEEIIFLRSKLESPKTVVYPKRNSLKFVSLGMTVFDDIEYPDRGRLSTIGGEGIWATFGARLFKPREHSKEIGCLLVSREDYPYPQELLETLEHWGVTTICGHYADQPINRAHVKYEDKYGLRRTIDYHEPPFKPMVRHLVNTILMEAFAYHLTCAPRELKRQRNLLHDLRARVGMALPPCILWQPSLVKAAPKVPEDSEQKDFEEYRNSFLEVLPLVHVFSLSYQGLRDITKGVGWPAYLGNREVRESVEDLAKLIPQSRIGSNGTGLLVVHCEPNGYYYRTFDESGWVKSYAEYYISENIVDFTGSGSAFLGAFIVAYADKNGLKDSVRRGSVAASFAIEQFGLPTMRHPPDALPDRELWNNEKALDRLRILRIVSP